ncbi:MAG: Ig-like domain-containing protein [Leptospiraceae bacterium]|nr:Ig-like domain-containing protein [Leptospiraceae bacterium]MCP5499803.1 Ig-like domain-containing protein [Leptospiraceae bacterium]
MNNVRDLEGNTQENPVEELIYFTTNNNIDNESPSIKTSYPANSSSEIVRNTSIQLVFNEALDPDTVSNETIILKQGDTILEKELEFIGSVVQLKPSAIFSSWTNYTIFIQTGIKDLAGNSLATATNISFTTNDILDNSPPVVETVIPTDGSTNVSNNTLITLIFSEAIDITTLNTQSLSIVEIDKNENSKNVPGTVSGEEKTLIFRVNESFRTSTKHRITILGTIKDLAGNSLGENKTYSFTTGRLVTYTVAGTVSGLSGTLVLQKNGGDDITITSNGSFKFSTDVAGDYSVTVKTQPTGQTCTVSNASGTAITNVTNVSVSCQSFTIGGTVTGLSGMLVLQNNGGDELSINADGNFTFSKSVAYLYNVTIKTQPAGQTCTLSNGIGTATANVSNVSVSCVTTNYTIGGELSGMGSSKSIVLQLNSGNELTLNSNGNFTFATNINYNTFYAVTVKTNPTDQTCTVLNASGTITSNVSNIVISCDPYMEAKTWYVDNGDGTIYDKSTGLIWKKCSQGQTWNNNTNACDGNAGTYYYCNEMDNDCNGGNNTGILGTFLNDGSSTAYNSCNDLNTNPTGGFAGKTGWRVPTIEELKTLIDLSGENEDTGAKINGIFFPNTILSGYWSASGLISSDLSAWYVYFLNGSVDNYTKTYYLNNVRCVRYGP